MTQPTFVFYTCLSLLILSLSIPVVTCSTSNSRYLEDAGNDYAFDVTPYSVQTGSCFRLKQINDNDDDGNAYFYNGAYRAQYTRYTSFYLCGNSKNNNNNNNNLSNCKMFVTDLPTYLEMSVNFLQTYCTTCQATCRRSRQRVLNEDGEQDQQQQQQQYSATADCNTCSKQCKSLVSDSSNGNSAINYLQCDKSYNDGDLQYYSAPQCGNPDLGQYAIIGQFYDEDCTIKLNNDEAGSKFGLSYSYGIFDTVMSSKINCASNEQYCTALASSAINCGIGDDDNNLDDNGSKLCRSAQQAAAVYTYYKKPFAKRFHIKAFLLIFLVLGTLTAFLSYTYFVRHNRERLPKILDDQVDNIHTNNSDNNNNTHVTGDYKLSSADGTTASDLPVIN
jgi:hypothetical protein